METITINILSSTEIVKNILLLLRDGGRSFTDLFFYVTHDNQEKIIPFDLNVLLIFLENEKIIETDYFSYKKEYCCLYSYDKVDFENLDKFIGELFIKKRYFKFTIDKDLVKNILEAIGMQSYLNFIEIRDKIEKIPNNIIDLKTNWLILALHLLYLEQQNKIEKYYWCFEGCSITAYKLIK